jgi:hypothetical protein
VESAGILAGQNYLSARLSRACNRYVPVRRDFAGRDHPNQRTFAVPDNDQGLEATIIPQILPPAHCIVDLSIEPEILFLHPGGLAFSDAAFVITQRCDALAGQSCGQHFQTIVFSPEQPRVSVPVVGPEPAMMSDTGYGGFDAGTSKVACRAPSPMSMLTDSEAVSSIANRSLIRTDRMSDQSYICG